ncbi:MAG: response regulator transcription factor [Candidatus Dormibacteraeota bacterium]|uniref:DNA-binding response regulator n=1 Tax=Candidatus Aeolococcus gillhamiae TaxID=3127015 RepID=A0A2W6AKR8_9BACT|nr:response regulator transcription factor [Candidatus Dormibacteraeota bacterium]PZR84214.1 MAG: DNA-binding response regulator [Candidatus Dormibacter sp. RRmetagenome_bin12]
MSETARILLAEDDRALRQSIAAALRGGSFTVEAVSDGVQAAQRLREEPYDVVLLDIGLPFVDGWEILQQIEGRRQPSVIVISARGEERDKVRALDLGADDYLTKPFGADELLARLRAVLRRVRSTGDAGVARAGEVVVDLTNRSVTRAGAEVRLSPTEWVLLAELASHPGMTRDHRTLLGRVWGPAYIGDRNYLRTFIQRLRRKLEDDPANPGVIVTVGHQGYRFGSSPLARDR